VIRNSEVHTRLKVLKRAFLVVLVSGPAMCSEPALADSGPCEGIKQSLVLLTARARTRVQSSGVLPTDDELAELATEIALATDPWGGKWRIGGTALSPSVYTAGEDGVAGTVDDVSLERVEKTCPYDGSVLLRVEGAERVVPFRLPRQGHGRQSSWVGWPTALAVVVTLGAVGFALMSERS